MMVSCSHCGHSTIPGSNFCTNCGQLLKDTPAKPKKTFFGRMPSWLLALIAIATVLGFMAFIVLLIAGISTFEGVASLIFLAIGVLLFIVYPLKTKAKEKASSGKSILGAVVVFYAFMGGVIDQTGNKVYNKPVEWCNCPAGTSLDRKTDVTHPYGGKTIYSQDFTCYDEKNEVVKQVSMVWVILIRFGEYILVALLLVALQRLIWSWKMQRAT